MPCKKKLQVGDFGWGIRLTFMDCVAVRDISAATIKEVILGKPDGTKLTKPATFVTNGTDGKIQYVVETGVIDQSNYWEVQGHASGPGFETFTEVARFEIGSNI